MKGGRCRRSTLNGFNSQREKMAWVRSFIKKKKGSGSGYKKKHKKKKRYEKECFIDIMLYQIHLNLKKDHHTEGAEGEDVVIIEVEMI